MAIWKKRVKEGDKSRPFTVKRHYKYANHDYYMNNCVIQYCHYKRVTDVPAAISTSSNCYMIPSGDGISGRHPCVPEGRPYPCECRIFAAEAPPLAAPPSAFSDSHGCPPRPSLALMDRVCHKDHLSVRQGRIRRTLYFHRHARPTAPRL